MATLEILTVPDHRLRIKAKPVPSVNDEVHKILDDMLETLLAEDGLGLAATQVNIHQRIIVMNMRERGEQSESGIIYKVINPEIVWVSQEKSLSKEGCFSVPGCFAEVMRHDKVRVKFLDEHGKNQEIEAEGLFAQCIQHEMDHLDGKLTIDYLSPLKKEMALKKITKIGAREMQNV